VVAAVATVLFVPESPIKAPSRINWTAAALLSAGLAAVLLAISEAPSWGWGSPKTIGLAAVGLLVLATWVWVELHSREPLVDMRVMQLPAVWRTNLVAFLLGAGMYSSFILIPQLVELPKSTGFGFGASVTKAGLFLVPATLGMLVAGPISGRLSSTVGSRVPLILGAAFSCAAFVLLTLAHSEHWQIYTAMAVMGIGIGFAFSSMANLIVESVPASQTGVATGMNTIVRSIGGAIGSQVSAGIVTATLAASGLPTERGFTIAFLVAAAALAVGVFVALRVPAPATAVRDEGIAEAA